MKKILSKCAMLSIIISFTCSNLFAQSGTNWGALLRGMADYQNILSPEYIAAECESFMKSLPLSDSVGFAVELYAKQQLLLYSQSKMSEVKRAAILLCKAASVYHWKNENVELIKLFEKLLNARTGVLGKTSLRSNQKEILRKIFSTPYADSSFQERCFRFLCDLIPTFESNVESEILKEIEWYFAVFPSGRTDELRELLRGIVSQRSPEYRKSFWYGKSLLYQ